MRKFLLLKLVSLMLIGTCHGLTKIDALAHAIAHTEGFYIKGTIPNRLHNPGDITASSPHAYAGQTRTYRGYAVFKSDSYGWAALTDQITRVIEGVSTKYTQEMTFAQIAKVYAQDPRWGRTVCKILQISPSLTFAEYFNLPPRVLITGADYGSTTGFTQRTSVSSTTLLIQRLFQTIPLVGFVSKPRSTEMEGSTLNLSATKTRVDFIEGISMHLR